jgi:hypothetical protein
MLECNIILECKLIKLKRQKAYFTETYVGLPIQNDDKIHASLTPPLFFYFIEVPAPSQKSERVVYFDWSCGQCRTQYMLPISSRR